jgi:GT2 family glycosyltransferase
MGGDGLKISVIIVSYNTSGLLKRCLESLYRYPGSHELEVFVVDNDSKDDSVQMVKDNFKDVILIENEINMGFAAANNQAYERATGDYIILLNPDTEIKPGSIDNAVNFLESHPEAALCGGRLINPEGELDPSARRFPNSLYKLFTITGLSDKYPDTFLGRGDFKSFDHNSVMEVDWVPGTFTVYRQSVLKQFGLFDERFYVYYEETDLCLRIKRAGWKVYFLPDAEVIHVGGASAKTRKDLKFQKGGSQVMMFRLRSEYLYFRKNFGLFSVLANAGVEIGWFLLRYLANLRPGGEIRQLKREESMTIVKHALQALKDTKFGKISPPRPWGAGN